MVHEFDLTDADGKVHHYVVTVHPGREGMVIVAKIAELGSETLGQLATQLLAGADALDVLQAAARGDDGAKGKLEGLAKTLDLAQASRSVRPLIAAAPDLVRQILKNTLRGDAEGKEMRKLSDDVWFSHAYQANYVELAEAVWKVVALNRFFPWPATSTGSGRP